jgi:hypothetical protein
MGGGNLSHNSQQCQSGSDQHSTFFDDADYSAVAQFVFLTTSYSIISIFTFAALPYDRNQPICRDAEIQSSAAPI